MKEEKSKEFLNSMKSGEQVPCRPHVAQDRLNSWNVSFGPVLVVLHLLISCAVPLQVG